MREICPWDISELEWDGLNSHSPLNEGGEHLLDTWEDIVAARKISHDLQTQRLKKYKASEKGQAAEKRYQESEKGILGRRGRVTKYKQTEKGKAANKKWFKKYRARSDIKVKRNTNEREKTWARQRAIAVEVEERIKPYINRVTAEDMEFERKRTQQGLRGRKSRATQKNAAMNDSDSDDLVASDGSVDYDDLVLGAAQKNAVIDDSDSDSDDLVASDDLVDCDDLVLVTSDGEIIVANMELI